MMEGSGTLEDQLDATKVWKDIHITRRACKTCQYFTGKNIEIILTQKEEHTKFNVSCHK